MKKINKIVLVISLCFILTLSIGASAAILGTMGGKEVSDQEVYAKTQIASQGQGLTNIVDKELLNKDYSYDKNEKVKQKAQEKIDQLKKSNPDYLSQYNAKDDKDLLNKTNTLYQIQKEMYTTDVFNKTYVTDKTMKALYDAKSGELISYYSIQLDNRTFDNNQQKLDEALKDIKTQLAKATDKDAESIFKGLVAKYPGPSEINKFKDAISRDDVPTKLLPTLDKYKFLQFNKEAIDIDGTKYFVLKMDKGERATFEASKDRLKEVQFTKAKESNKYLVDYLMVQLRNSAKINFKDNADKAQYDAVNQQIIDNYNKALKEAKK